MPTIKPASSAMAYGVYVYPTVQFHPALSALWLVGLYARSAARVSLRARVRRLLNSDWPRQARRFPQKPQMSKLASL